MTAEHGTASRYRYGCRCAPCRYAAAAQRRVSRPYGDAEAVKAHIRELSAAGLGYRHVAKLAGVTVRTVWRILYEGGRPMAETAERILAVRADAGLAQRWVPAVGTARRLQALRAVGWSNLILSQRLGVAELSASQLAMQRRSLAREATADGVRKLYAELSERPAPLTASARRNRTYAHARRWFPPIAWDDEVLDDPDALPCLLPPVEPVDRELELLVQHLAAGHPVEPTTAAVKEVIRRMPGAKPAEIAPIARRPARAVANIRSHMKAAACR